MSVTCFLGLGFGLILPSTFMAVKSYFTTRRSQAVGLSMAGTGVGQMLMPQVVRFLLDEFGYRGTTLILGGLCLNGLVGALLFQVRQLKIPCLFQYDFIRNQYLAREVAHENRRRRNAGEEKFAGKTKRRCRG